MAERHISVPKPFANGDVNEWFKRYEICCKANGWNEATIALKLPTLLEGGTLAVWLELSEEQQQSYAKAKKELSIALKCLWISLDNFHRRTMRPGEALAVFVHDLKSSSNKPCRDWMHQPQSNSYCTNFLLEYHAESVSQQLRASGDSRQCRDASATPDDHW